MSHPLPPLPPEALESARSSLDNPRSSRELPRASLDGHAPPGSFPASHPPGQNFPPGSLQGVEHTEWAKRILAEPGAAQYDMDANDRESSTGHSISNTGNVGSGGRSQSPKKVAKPIRKEVPRMDEHSMSPPPRVSSKAQHFQPDMQASPASFTRRSLDHINNDINQGYPHNSGYSANGFPAVSGNGNVGTGSPNMGATASPRPRPARIAPLDEPINQPRQRDTQVWDNASSVGDHRRPRSQYPEQLQQHIGNAQQWASQPYPDQRRMYEDPRDFLPQEADPFYGNSYDRNESSMYGGIPPPEPRNSSPALMNQSHLQPGNKAALLSNDQSMAMYRANARKNSNPELVFEFAAFMLEASKSIVVPPADSTYSNQMEIEKANEKRESYVKEALSLLKKIADRGHVLAQYTLADCYSNGIGTVKGRQDFDRAFPLFVHAAKHNHVDASYRAGACCEYGWGCRKDSSKAVQFYRKAAAQQHPGALFRLGQAEMNGELGLSKNAKEGVKWLKRSAENATAEFPHALHELALCHESGVTNVVFVDLDYAAELLAQASELGYAPSAFRLGECYEYGTMGCPQDPALSIHYYNIAAQQGHRDACFSLTAWYLVGSPGVLPQSDTEAFLWAKRAADAGLAKAQYAVGYFYETGIGTQPSNGDAMIYFKLAADQGDKRAITRLKGNPHQHPGRDAHGNPLAANYIRGEVIEAGGGGGGKGGKECIIM